MRFNSQSVIMNRGTNFRVGVEIPHGLHHIRIPAELWDDAVEEFNKQLDSRKQVSELVDGIKVDILRLHLTGGAFYIWMAAKESNVPTMADTRFTFKGKLVYESEKSDQLESVLITDLLYGPQGQEKSIFRKELTS